jgi:hypothetical protein
MDNKSKQKRLNTPQKLPETSTKRSLFSMNNEQNVLDDDDYLHIDNIESENQDPNKVCPNFIKPDINRRNLP